MQIPALWNQIKYAAVNADKVLDCHIQDYLTKLLYDLLCENVQCFIRFTDNGDRVLQAIFITRIIEDKITRQRDLLVQCMYSFQKVSSEEWLDNMRSLETFARNSKCLRLIAYQPINAVRAFEIASMLGFEESYRCIVKELEV
jgi:hypothetical protein